VRRGTLHEWANFVKGANMDVKNEEERFDPSKFTPTGTWTLLCLIIAGMVAAWLFLYFGVFLPRGSVQ